MKLTHTQDFVLLENFSTHIKFFPECYIKHALFLKSELKLENIVPIDIDGYIIEKPKFFYNDEALRKLTALEKEVALKINERMKVYEEALEKVWFKDVMKLEVPNGKNIYRINGYPILLPDPLNDKKYIILNAKLVESLIPYDVELTEAGIKQFM